MNLLATPVVDLALAEPVNDQNFLRNGNFYSSFWSAPTGKTCPVNVETSNANYWYTKPQGAAVTTKRSTSVPDTNSLFSHEVDGAVGVTTVEFGQNINGDLSATLRRICTFSGNIFNNTGLVVSPKLEIYTADAFNNFTAKTLRTTIDLQTCSNGIWTFVSATLDLSTITNVTNGISVVVLYPSGTLSAVGKNMNHSRFKFQIGEIATEFTDDVSLFVTAPSVDSTMLQDGCIARPSLFLPNVVPTGAYQAKSINNGDVNDAAIDGRCMASGAAVANLGYTPINKAGDSVNGQLIWNSNDDVVGTGSIAGAAALVSATSANASNDGYMPAISFNRPGIYARALGLSTTGKFKTVDHNGTVGYLLDTVNKVDTNSYQDASITYAKLAQSLINLICPVGMIIMYAGPNIPAGWFACDGSWAVRTTYPALFAAIGTYWGVADGNLYFALPNLQGRVPVGYVNNSSTVSGITSRGYASYGGEENHQLTAAELASHAHGVTDPGHNHLLHDPAHTHTYVNPIGGLGSAIGSGQYSAVGSTNTGAAATGITIDASTTHVTIQNSGGNGAHNIMQPYAVCYYLIKAI